jgi:murein L,D-transpeptidase YafK
MKTLLTFTFLLIATQLYSAEYKVDAVRVYKSKHIMEMLFEGEVTKTYKVMLGRGGMGPKIQEGDKKVPEGEYMLDFKNPYSDFYRSIHISYPNQNDMDNAAKLGVKPGQDIYIHGMPNIKLKKKQGDWTAGCVAVENYQMREIWNNLQVEKAPIPITIYP